MRYRTLGVIVLLGAAAVLFQAASAKPQIENGKEVGLAYKLFVDGTLLETADAKEPFLYTHGKNQIVPGLERALLGLRVKDRKTVKVASKDAYGPVDPKAFQEVSKDKFPSEVPVQKGVWVEARNPQGVGQLVKISEVKGKTVVIDFNHPLAGKDLEFQVEVLSIK